ncbi:MAG: DUF3604 domain-containing protein [Steroidobacteraceae bacterium]
MKIQSTVSMLYILLGAMQPTSAEPACGPLRNVYFGDLHLHTSFSFDAYIIGTETTPDQAYRFARGEPVNYMGHRMQRRWPLDFMAVTDHAENLGIASEIKDPESAFSKTDSGRRIRWAYFLGKKEGDKVFWDVEWEKDYKQLDPKGVASAWQKEIKAANTNYRPGTFTTFIAYEWSTMVDVQYHFHRNVIFKGDSAPLPFSAVDSKRPEDLWTYLETNRKRGIEALAIPHTADLSNGLMYDWNDSYGKPIDQGYALRRVLNEPLSEISQIKGQSETHPLLSLNDEFAKYEIMSMGNIHGSYVREAYGRGLVLGARTGANPYQFGIVGGSDIHSGLSLSDAEPYGEMHLLFCDASDGAITSPSEFATGNLTGVWAERNTRDSIYEALRRKETFATSGSRLKIRFFGGWNFSQDILNKTCWWTMAYAKGVPMGGDLPKMSAHENSPTFIVDVLKDPDGANLDRAQIVKVWREGDEYREKVFDVVWSDRRIPDHATNRLPVVGNTVDLKNGSYTNTIGAVELKGMWVDPEFSAKNAAVYYLRVLEIPTPRWSTVNAVRIGSALPSDVPAVVQQRGWSSPIWYNAPAPQVLASGRDLTTE